MKKGRPRISGSVCWLALLASVSAQPARAGDPPHPSEANADLDSVLSGDQSASPPAKSDQPVSAGPSQTGASAPPAATSLTPAAADVPAPVAVQPTEAATPVKPDAPSSAAVAPHSSNRVVEEIVVTAQKREEEVQTVPISVAAFSASALDARGAFDTKALVTLTPAVTVTEFGGFSFIYIRGVGSDAFVPSADPSVTTYVDGIFVPTSQGFATDFGGIKRVEILKGPQGTLFGRNSTGGAISVITKKPGEDFEANVEGEVGNFNEKRAKSYINLPLTSTFGVSADLLYKYLQNQYTNYDRGVSPTKDLSGRFRADWHPTSYFDLDLSYFRSHQETAGSLVAKNIAPSPIFSLIIPKEPDNYVADTDFNEYVKGSSYVYSFAATLNLPWFDIKAMGASQDTNSSYSSIDFDASPIPLVDFYTNGQFSKAKTLELQFLSSPDGWGGKDFEWVGGAYYLKGSGGFDKIYLQPANDLVDYVVNTLKLPSSVLGLLSPILTPLNSDVNVNLLASGIVAINSISGYAQTTWHTTDWLSLTLGGRYQRERRYLTQAYTDGYIPATGTTIPLFDFPLESTTATNFSSRQAISVQPAEGQMIYASRSQGFKSGTYNVINIDQIPNYVKPELVTSYEIGTKSDFFGGLLRLNTAIFDNIVKDKQVAFVSLLSGGAVSLSNAGKAQILGGEFDTTWVPLPDLDSGLAITANGAYLYGVYKDYTNGQGYSGTTGLYQNNLDFTGKEIERTPKFSGGVGISQAFDLDANDEVEVGMDVYYNSGFYFTPENKADLKQDAYKLLNARASYLYKPANIRVTAFGKNILSERYHIGLFQTDFGTLSTLAYPVQYGVSLAWNF